MPRELLLVDALAGTMSSEGGVQEGLEFMQDHVDPEWRDQLDFSSTSSPTKKKSKKRLNGRPVETARVEGRIQVHVRIRPLLKRELDCGVCVTVNEDAKSVKVFTGKSALESTADSVIEEQISQADVFEQVKGSTESVLQGFNNTILAYGQTGTGKTYTILGGSYVDAKKQKKVDELRAARTDSAGLVPRLVLDLYSKIDGLQERGTAVKVRASYMEVYNEKVFDLLNNQSKSVRGDVKDVKQQRITLEVRDKEVIGLTFCEVRNSKELLALVRKANINRAVRHTAMNTHSSRSHSILQLVLEQKHDGKIVKSKLSLVDLAGSERWDETDTSSARVQEMTSINQGLSALASVVNALQAKEKVSRRKEMNPDSPFAPVHVPYRDSKLTHLLMDSLGGNCRTTMIATISPSKLSAEESISTLRFADRVRAIQNRAVAMAETDPNAVLEAKEGEIQRLKSLLAMLSSSAEGQEFASIREALEQVSRELEASRQELDDAKQVLEEERRARQDLENTLSRFTVHGGSALSSRNNSSGYLPHLTTRKSDSDASDDAQHSPADSSDTRLPPIGGGNSPREEPVTEAAILDLSSSPAEVEEAPSAPDQSPETPPQPVVNPRGALAASLQSQGVEIETKKRPEPVKHARDRAASPPKQPPAEMSQGATAARDVSKMDAAAQHATQHASAPAAAVAPTVRDGGAGCAFIEGWNPDQPRQQPQPRNYGRAAGESLSGRRNHAQQAASSTLGGTTGGHNGYKQELNVDDAAAQPEVQDYSAGSKPGYTAAARRSSGSEQDQYHQALAGDERPQDQTVSKEFIAIGGILGEITKIRTELRTIISTGDEQPGNQQAGSRHIGGGERAAHPREAAMMQRAYDRNGVPRNSNKGGKGSYQYVHVAYGYPSATSRPAPHGGRSSAMGRDGRNRRPSAASRAGKQGALRGTSYSAPGGSEVYFSPALHRAALGGGASEPGRVRRQGGVGAKLSPINHKQPSMTAPTPTTRRLRSDRAAARPAVPTVTYPKPQGIPNHMGVGTWMYIMGPHASSSRAMQLAELESVAGFDTLAERAPAHLLRAGR